jgi:hypothetical protein
MVRLKGKIVLVTGGASFISSLLVDTLVRKGAQIKRDLSEPQGVSSKAADPNKALKMLGLNCKFGLRRHAKLRISAYLDGYGLCFRIRTIHQSAIFLYFEIGKTYILWVKRLVSGEAR